MRLGLPGRKPVTGRRRGLPALLIAVVMIALPLLVVDYAFTHKLPFGSQYTDYAIVSNSVNVRSGSPVRIAGIDVGAVTGVTADGNATKIAFTIAPNARPIHTDATMTIRDRLFLEGGYYLQLDPGSPTAPVAGEGFTIPERSTASPVQFFQILSTFDVAARADLEQLLNTANQAFSPAAGAPESDSGAGGFKQAIPSLTPILKDVSWVSQALRGSQYNDVDDLLTGSSRVATTLADNSRQLADLVTGLDRAASALAADDGDVGQSISGLDATLKEAPATLRALNSSLPPLTTLANALTPSLKASPVLVSSLTSEIKAVTKVVAPRRRGPLLSSLKTLLATFPSVLRQLASLFPSTTELTSCLREKVVPLLQEQVQDGALSTHQPVWKELVHFMPNLASASGDFDADGPYTRVLGALGTDSADAGDLGSLPGVGQLIGSLPGNANNADQGVSPHWVGDLQASAFRPDVSCTSQPLPTDLSSDPATADQTSTTSATAGAEQADRRSR